MSSAYIGNQLSMETALLGGVLALGMAPFVLLALPTALLGRAILNEIQECQKERSADAILEGASESAPYAALRLGDAVREQLQTLLDGEREKIRTLKNGSVRKSLEAIQEKLQADCLEQLSTGNIRDLDVLFRELRVKISEAQIEERSWSLSLQDFKDRCRIAHKKISNKNALRLEELQQEAEKLGNLPFDEGFSRIIEMTAELRTITQELIETSVSPNPSKEIDEILDCAARIAQIDPQEREKLLPLLDELEHPSPFESRISMIHRQVRLTYAAVRERAAQTHCFKEELGPLLPLISLIPTGESLAERIQSLLQSEFIERKTFLALYEETQLLLAQTQENLADAILTEKVSSILEEMGYSLDAEEEKTWKPGQIVYLNSPYDGYSIMLKISEKRDVAIRLVRKVATETEREHTSSYQRQKDVEIGKKWCKDLDAFLERMRAFGIPLDTALRQEPHEAPLLVVVDHRLAEGQKKQSGKTQEHGALSQRSER